MKAYKIVDSEGYTYQATKATLLLLLQEQYGAVSAIAPVTGRVKQVTVDESNGVEKNLFVRVKPQYGKDVLYPDCENSKLLTRIAGTKTITSEHKKLLELMGY